MAHYWIFASLVLLVAYIVLITYYGLQEDDLLTTPQLVQKHGYPIETHHVTTLDGYILEIHRIPFGKTSRPTKGCILLMHGIWMSSAAYVLPDVNRAIAYVYVEAGYDVWLGNSRGNTYGRKHKTLDPNYSSKFWDYSYHEIGIYDIPAIIDYILNVTGRDALHYLGHSLGSAFCYILCAEKPEYNKKIISHHSIAPAVFLKHIYNKLLQVLATFQQSELAIKFSPNFEILSKTTFNHYFAEILCGDRQPAQPLCLGAYYFYMGYSPEQTNTTVLPLLFSHTPAGSSWKQFLHILQQINTGKFGQYDYGKVENIIKYGSEFPPEYNLSKVETDVYMYYGDRDQIGSETDLALLYSKLPNPKLKYIIPTFTHLDYYYGIDVKELLLNKIISDLSQY